MNPKANDLQNLWQQTGGDDLLQGKNFQQLFNESPNKHEAFILQDYDLRCIDEGTVGGVHLAGSGILYPQAELDLKGKISGIYSHTGCGAAKLYVEGQKISTENPDLIGDNKAKELADKLNISYLGRIEASDMRRPTGVHIARAIYYDGTGHFNPSQAKGLPLGFVISRKYISDVNYSKQEVAMAIKIAQGKNGFGDKFKEGTPLYLVATGDDKPDSLSIHKLVEELKEVAVKFPSIKIDSIVGVSNA